MTQHSATRAIDSFIAPATKSDVDRIVDDGKLAYVAITTRRGPVITPVLYGASGDSIWFVTHRQSLKVRALRRRPQTAWVIPGNDNEAAVVVGEARLVSLRDAASLGAVAPRLHTLGQGLWSWTHRNPRHVAGFIGDALTNPLRMLPQDQVIVELHATSATMTTTAPLRNIDSRPSENVDLTGALPPRLHSLLTRNDGVFGITTPAGPRAFPVQWTSFGAIHLPDTLEPGLGGQTVPACLTVDEPVQTRPTEQRGIVIRGTAQIDAGTTTVALRPERITYWDGFDTETVDLSRLST